MPFLPLQARVARPIILFATIFAFGANVTSLNKAAVSRLQYSSGRYSGSFVASGPQSSGNQPKPVSLSFCALVSRPEVYDQRIVRTTAILVAGYEQYFLYSQSCNREDEFVWAEGPPATELNALAENKLRSLLEASSTEQGAGRAQVTLLGRFIAPGPLRFGHLDEFQMKFVIMRIERVKAVSKKTAWPIAQGLADSADQTVRVLNKEFILHVAGALSYAVIPAEILADDFRFTESNGRTRTKSDFLAITFRPYSGSIRDTKIQVQVRGESAVATGLVVQSANDSTDKQYPYIVNYRQKDQEWQIVSAQLTSISN